MNTQYYKYKTEDNTGCWIISCILFPPLILVFIIIKINEHNFIQSEMIRKQTIPGYVTYEELKLQQNFKEQEKQKQYRIQINKNKQIKQQRIYDDAVYFMKLLYNDNIVSTNEQFFKNDTILIFKCSKCKKKYFIFNKFGSSKMKHKKRCKTCIQNKFNKKKEKIKNIFNLVLKKSFSFKFLFILFLIILLIIVYIFAFINQ